MSKMYFKDACNPSMMLVIVKWTFHSLHCCATYIKHACLSCVKPLLYKLPKEAAPNIQHCIGCVFRSYSLFISGTYKPWHVPRECTTAASINKVGTQGFIMIAEGPPLLGRRWRSLRHLTPISPATLEWQVESALLPRR